MKLSRRSNTETANADEFAALEGVEATGKGRPTPKRRDTVGPRGPVTAPKSRKEAYARQKQQAKTQKAARSTPAAQLTVAQRRALMKAGDPSVLPRRDQGNTKKLARDWVDSHRMASNYLGVVILLFIGGYALPALQLVAVVGLIGMFVEWVITGRRIRALTIERFGEAQGGAVSIGVYAGSRAYLPRRWRLPAPQVSMNEAI